MPFKDIGSLIGADEGLHHQIVDTFATVSQADLAWTEKIWASIAKTDGSLQLDFGLGRYHNRGVMDGFGGVSRGREQWTVRASRELAPDVEVTAVGPLRYEVITPLEQVRFVLEPNDAQPISFDVTLTGVTPPSFEERNLVRNKRTGRVETDVIRYHQGGWASGTITVDGATHQIEPDEWFGYRDHSWGVRQAVGEPPTDIIPSAYATADGSPIRGGFKWSPMFLQRPDGTYYETAIHVIEGLFDYCSAHIRDADGTEAEVRSIEPRMTYDTCTRYLTGGELHLVMASGETRVIEIEVLGTSGFVLKTAGYGSWGGHKHGSWQGPLHVAGDYVDDVGSEEYLPQLGQLRDTPVRVREGDAVGYGIMESLIMGEWPDLGLTSDSDHVVSFT